MVQPFKDVLQELDDMQTRKGKDYGSAGDSLANVRASEDFGVPSWLGCIMRANDKMRRIQTAGRQQLTTGQVNLANESVEDSLLDLAVYAIHALRLFREAAEAGDPPAQYNP